MNKKKKILLVSIVFLVCVAMTSHVFGAINNIYTTSTADATWLNDIAEGNSLLKPIAYLLLWLAGLVEWLLSSLANMVGSSSAVMPWADAILFNAVPLLDPNFINPANGSITAILGGVLGKIYFTVFYLSVSFFSISVLLMAIKLAVSSIASERAKYKEAITNWIIGMVLLFSMHFLMSFCFYLNESLVTIASNIAMDSLNSSGFNLTVDEDKIKEKADYAVDDLVLSTDAQDKQVKEIFNNNLGIFNQLMGDSTGTMEDFWTKGINGDVHTVMTLAAMVNLVSNINNISAEDLKSPISIYSNGQPTYYPPDFPDGMTAKQALQVVANGEKTTGNYLAYLVTKAAYTNTSTYDWYAMGEDYGACMDPKGDPTNQEEETTYSSMEKKIASILLNLCNHVNSDGEFKGLGETPITQLANYFKYTCFDYDDESNMFYDGKINPVHVLLYVIFVVQSLLYFFAYVKRLFYIIVLAMMAPIIVTYNFVMQI